MRILIFLLSIAMTQSLFALGIYKWVDEDGKKIYGNKPPENVTTDEVSLPKITIVAGENTYQESSAPQPTESNNEQSDTQINENNPSSTQKEQTAVIPSSIDIIAPLDDEAIRANNGNITLKFDVKPTLKTGENIVVYLDGKQQTVSSTAVIALEYLDRGTHSLFAIKRGADGKVLANSKNIKFHVLRHSKLF